MTPDERQEERVRWRREKKEERSVIADKYEFLYIHACISTHLFFLFESLRSSHQETTTSANTVKYYTKNPHQKDQKSKPLAVDEA